MRKSILIICAVILLFCLWLLVHGRKGPEGNSPLETRLTNQQPASQAAATFVQKQPAASTVEAEAKYRATPEGFNALQQRLQNEWEKPIEFYGKVIDENSNPVAGANIQFKWSGSSDDVFAAATKSDTNGLFSFQGKQGSILDVSVSKEGYYTSRNDKTGFLYSLGPDIYSPEEWNPVIFHLHKKGKGESLIHIAGIGLRTMRDYLLASDGKPTDVSLLTGQRTPAGQGDLEIVFVAGPPLNGLPSRITWQCKVTVPGGGLIPTTEEFPFLAPRNGYQASDELNITATNWTAEANQQYYIKLRNGNFGRVNLRLIGTARPYFRLVSFVNPSGSRDLEPSN